MKPDSSHPRAACAVERLENRRLFSLPFGSTDTAFGVLGHAVVPIDGATDTPQVDQVIAAANGEFYVGGSDGIARFTAAGAVDQTFGSNGVAALAGGTFVAEAIDSQGRVYALVTTSNGTALLRYTARGAVDQSYGAGGTAQIISDTSFTPAALAVQPNNQLIVAGTEATDSGGGAEMRVFRISSDGSLDSAFGNDGSLEASLGVSTSVTPIVLDKVVGVSVLANGEILVGGGSVAYAPTIGDNEPVESGADFAVARLTSAGELDSSYGSGGLGGHQRAEHGQW